LLNNKFFLYIFGHINNIDSDTSIDDSSFETSVPIQVKDHLQIVLIELDLMITIKKVYAAMPKGKICTKFDLLLLLQLCQTNHFKLSSFCCCVLCCHHLC